ALEQETAEIPEAARSVPAPSCGGVDPDLLELHRLGRPGGRLGLEEDHAVLDPQPRALVLDLAPRAPAKALGVARERIEPELLLVRGGACGHQEVEILERGRTEPGLPGVGWRADDEDRLPRAILARSRETFVGGVPQLGHCERLADHHPRRRTRGLACERAAA